MKTEEQLVELASAAMEAYVASLQCTNRGDLLDALEALGVVAVNALAVVWRGKIEAINTRGMQ